MSKHTLALAALFAAALFALPATAADETKPRHAADHEMDKEGDRHEPAEGTQQHKMKTCNIEAHKRELHGDERRAFMSACLKKSA